VGAGEVHHTLHKANLGTEVGQPKGEAEGRAPGGGSCAFLQTVSSGVGKVATGHLAQVAAATALSSYSQLKGKQYYLPLET